MKKEPDKWIFSTGRYILDGCVTGHPESLRLNEGYDHELSVQNPDGTPSYGELSPQELVELADAMIEQWTQFKVNAQRKKASG